MNWTQEQSNQGSYNCLVFGLCIFNVVPRSEILRAMLFSGGHFKFLRTIYYYQWNTTLKAYFTKAELVPIICLWIKAWRTTVVMPFYQFSFEPISSICGFFPNKNRKCCFQTKTPKINANLQLNRVRHLDSSSAQHEFA